MKVGSVFTGRLVDQQNSRTYVMFLTLLAGAAILVGLYWYFDLANR
jgi:predicted MFS family arabinose efflux permease